MQILFFIIFNTVLRESSKRYQRRFRTNVAFPDDGASATDVGNSVADVPIGVALCLDPVSLPERRRKLGAQIVSGG